MSDSFEVVKLFACHTMPEEARRRFIQFWDCAEGDLHFWSVRDDGIDLVSKWLLGLGAKDGERVLVHFNRW